MNTVPMHVVVPDTFGRTKAERIILMLGRKRGATAEEVAKTFGIKKATATARISVETRRRGLRAALVDGRYHLAAAA